MMYLEKYRNFFITKGYRALILILEIADLSIEQEFLTASIITDAKLNPDYHK